MKISGWNAEESIYRSNRQYCSWNTRDGLSKLTVVPTTIGTLTIFDRPCDPANDMSCVSGDYVSSDRGGFWH